ncbi:hypothetical protein Q8A67_024039 [Cirrhinus molitorella]|uniref:non-specific serine/threonine protein kinase n=1 Tax=Cirrhinus molitorella TaxID=172907 RepID=A0AA88PEY6_9TELE|nr:hypothetical protein Q8A67_024039 [Cirrhinus molitorella]
MSFPPLGQEVDDGDSGVEFSPEEPITSQSQVSDDWSDSVFQDVLGDLSEWRADVLDALNGVVSKFKDDSLQTPVHVAPDLSVDVPQAPVHATVECGVNDVPKTTVHAASDSTVDVPKPTVCSVHDLGVDVPQASVCATTDSDNDAPLAEICAEPKGEDEAPPVVFCAQPRSEDEAPPAEFCIEPESEDEAPPAEFYAESDSKDDALLDVFSAGPKCNVAIPQAPVCETEDTSVSPQSNQLQKKNSNIIEINSDSYEITTQLGQGGFGTVYAATRLKDGLQVAVKFASSKNVIFIRSDGYSKPVPLEVALLIKATQGSRVTEIIQLLDWEELRDHYRMVLELPFPCQSLSDFIRSYRGGLGEDMARIIMRQVTTAAQTCCRRGVLHRDIKPENFLITLDTLEVKLIDFGCGDILTDEAYRYYAGTYEFIPPEYTTTGKYHGEPATVWSLGFLLFIILFKKIPNKQDLWRINGHVWTKKGFSKECCHFMSSCLQSDPKKRLELEKVHLHKWFKKYIFKIFRMYVLLLLLLKNVTNFIFQRNNCTILHNTEFLNIHTCSYEMGIQLSVRFGTVYAATRLNDGLQVAVKFVSKKKKKLINIKKKLV